MVSQIAMALDNPLVLMEMLSTPQGRQAAAVILAREGVTPEAFFQKVAVTPNTQAADVNAINTMTGSKLAQEIGTEPMQPPQGGSPMPFNTQDLFNFNMGAGLAGQRAPMPAAPTVTPPAAGAGASGMNFNPQQFLTALQGIQAPAAQGQGMSSAPGAVAPSTGNPGGLNPGSVMQLVQMALAQQGLGQAQQIPTLGQLIAGGIR